MIENKIVDIISSKEKKKLYMKKWYVKNKDNQIKRSREYYRDNKAIIRNKAKVYYKKNCEYLGKQNKQYREKYREIVFNYYGNNMPKCKCCGETIKEFLTIDHINNDGKIYRRNKKQFTGTGFYSWIITHDFPKYLQILCYNCNLAKGKYGFCPHEKRDSLNA